MASADPRKTPVAPPPPEGAGLARRRRKKRALLESPVLLVWVVALDLVGVAAAYLVGRFSAGPILALHLGTLSLLTLALFGIDKMRARRDARRVSEFNLMALAFLGGALGGVIGMSLFRHKRRRWSFLVLMPTFLFVHVVIAALIWLK